MGIFVRFMGAVRFVIAFFRKVLHWGAAHLISVFMLLFAVVALGGMVYLLMQRGNGDDGADASVAELPTLMPVAELVSGAAASGPVSPTAVPATAAPTVPAPAFLLTRAAPGGSAAAAEAASPNGASGDGGGMVAVEVAAPAQLRALVEGINEVRRTSNSANLIYMHSQAATDRLRLSYRPSTPDGVFPVDHAGWQALYSAAGGYLPSYAYMYVCPAEECNVRTLTDVDPIFLSSSARSYSGAYLEDRGRRVYLVAVARRYATLEVVPPVDRNGFVLLSGATDGGANVGSMTVTLYYRGLSEDGPSYGVPLALVTNPDLPSTGHELELPAGRWDTSGQSFHIEVDLSSYFGEDGNYTLALRANTGLEQEYIAAYTVTVDRSSMRGLGSLNDQATLPPPTPTPEPTRAVSRGKLAQPGFDGRRISQLVERDWGAGGDFLMVACRADAGGAPARWAEGIVFSSDGRYLSDGELVVVLVPGEVYPAVGKCHRMGVRFDGLRHWDFCRRPGTCGANEGVRLILPYYVMSRTEYWQSLDAAEQCAGAVPAEDEHGCWRSAP